MNFRSQPQRQIFMEEKLCVVYGGITAVLFILSFLKRNQTPNVDFYPSELQLLHGNLLREHCTLVNRKNVVFLQINAKPHSTRITQEKILDFSIHHIHKTFSTSDFHFFPSLQNAQNVKKFFQVKTFMENFLVLETSWILLEKN